MELRRGEVATRERGSKHRGRNWCAGIPVGWHVSSWLAVRCRITRGGGASLQRFRINAHDRALTRCLLLVPIRPGYIFIQSLRIIFEFPFLFWYIFFLSYFFGCISFARFSSAVIYYLSITMINKFARWWQVSECRCRLIREGGGKNFNSSLTRRTGNETCRRSPTNCLPKARATAAYPPSKYVVQYWKLCDSTALAPR